LTKVGAPAMLCGLGGSFLNDLTKSAYTAAASSDAFCRDEGVCGGAWGGEGGGGFTNPLHWGGEVGECEGGVVGGSMTMGRVCSEGL